MFFGLEENCSKKIRKLVFGRFFLPGAGGPNQKM
jgi:hypothetical protein